MQGTVFTGSLQVGFPHTEDLLFEGSSPGSRIGAKHPTDQRQENNQYVNTLTAPHTPFQLAERECRHHSLGMSGPL